jgi:hypothetical protein
MPATHLRLVPLTALKLPLPLGAVFVMRLDAKNANHASHHPGASHAFRKPHSILGQGARGEPWHLPARNHATSTPGFAMGST